MHRTQTTTRRRRGRTGRQRSRRITTGRISTQRAPEPILQARYDAMIARCRSYKIILINAIRQISMQNITPTPNITVGQVIDQCLNHVIGLINYFKRTKYMQGYLMNCEDDNEKREFVDRLLEIFKSSDYNNFLVFSIQNIERFNAQEAQFIRSLGNKYNSIITQIASFLPQINYEVQREEFRSDSYI